MEFELNREEFSKDDFNAKDYLNSVLKNFKEVDSSSDIIAFKLKITQREFSNEIDLNSNNVLKSNKTIANDLKIVHQLNSNVLDKINSTVKENKSSFNTDTPCKLLSANDHLNNAINLLHKNN